MRNIRRGFALFLLAAIFGFAVAGTMFWRATTVTHPEATRATARITALRDSLESVGHPGGEVHTLHALAWQPGPQRMVEASAPLWFVALKAPAVGWMLRGVDLDLAARGLTVQDMREQGPGLLLDETSPADERLLLWLE